MTVPSLHVFVFIQKLLVTCSCCFLFLFADGKNGRREVGAGAEGKMHGL